MLDGNSTNGNADCQIESNARIVKSLSTDSVSINTVSPDNNKILSAIVSDTKKLNEEIRSIVRLKSELRTSQDRLSRTAGAWQKPVKDPEIGGNKSVHELIKSDIEKLKDDMNDIRILKSELALYQSRISRKVCSLKMKEI